MAEQTNSTLYDCRWEGQTFYGIEVQGGQGVAPTVPQTTAVLSYLGTTPDGVAGISCCWHCLSQSWLMWYTHTHSHTHLLTHICFHIAQLCLAPMDRWPPSTHMVGRHPNSLTTTTRSAASASQLSLFGSFSGNFYLNYWCPVFVYFYIMCYLLLCSFMDLTRCLFMGWSKMFNLKKRHQ